MPYEALRDALTNIAGDYLRRKTEEQRFEREQAAEQARFERTNREEDRRYLRNRADTLSDEERRRKAALSDTKELSLFQIEEMGDAKRKQRAIDLGIDPNTPNLANAIYEATRARKEQEIIDAAKSGEKAAATVQPDAMKRDATAKFDENVALYTAARESGASLQNSLTSLATMDRGQEALDTQAAVASQLVSRVLPPPGPAREKYLKEIGIDPKTPANKITPELILSKDYQLFQTFETQVKTALASKGMAPDIMAAVERVRIDAARFNAAYTGALNRGINIKTDAESQGWFQRGAPEGYKMPPTSSSFFTNPTINEQSTQTKTGAPAATATPSKVSAADLAGALGSGPATGAAQSYLAPGAANPAGSPGAVPAPASAPAGVPAPAGVEVAPPPFRLGAAEGTPSFFGLDRDPALNQQRVIDAGRSALRFLSPSNWRVMNNGTVMYDPGYTAPAPAPAQDPAAVAAAQRQLTPAYLRRMGPVQF